MAKQAPQRTPARVVVAASGRGGSSDRNPESTGVSAESEHSGPGVGSFSFLFQVLLMYSDFTCCENF